MNKISRLQTSLKHCNAFLLKFHNTISLSKMVSNPVEQSIHQKLSDNLHPVHLQIINESWMHNVPKGSETHFKVVVISEKFAELSLIKRHRMVNQILKEELNTGVHALSLETKTPDQWKPNEVIEQSPSCRGGFGK